MVPSGGINALAIDHFKCNLIEQLFENVQKEDETNQCESHPTQKLNYFCEKCTALICPECCLEEHQNHPTIRIEVKYYPLQRQLYLIACNY